MDNSWLFDNEVDNGDPESDDEETQRELESRLYAIVHHNDLSQPLPPELAKHYSVVRADDGELEVTLKHSLDEIKNEEMASSCFKQNDNPLEHEELNEIHFEQYDKGSAASIFPVIEIGSITVGVDRVKRLSLKRARYSDVNLDTCATEKDVDSPPQDINFFNHGPKLFRGKINKQFSKLIIPSSLDYSDWKDAANSSFISINESQSGATIVDKMTQALLKCNPGVKVAKLAKCALAFYKRNLKLARKKASKKLKNSKSSTYQSSLVNDDSKSTIDLTQELNLLRNKLDDEIQECKANISKKRRKDMNGSISLNISPFRPEPQFVDLVSDEDNGRTEENTIPTSTPKLKIQRNKLQLPLKWSREMALFYTKPSKRKMNMDVDSIIQHLKRTTKAGDWKVDPRDEMGFYHRSGNKKRRKCANCNERGHGAQQCPRPLKCCILCGEPSHMSYSCPCKICLKCGLYLPKSYEGDECRDCYFTNFSNNTACEICGSVCHRSVICTDLWRSYHATTEGEKKIPKVKPNPRKFCCNCGNGKHFCEDCPFPQFSGQQASSFVTNYAFDIEELGTAEICFPHDCSDILTCPQADMFLHDLSNYTNAKIMQSKSQEGLLFQIKGTFELCKNIKHELETFVNVNKRKWQGPTQSRKRQRVT